MYVDNSNILLCLLTIKCFYARRSALTHGNEGQTVRPVYGQSVRGRACIEMTNTKCSGYSSKNIVVQFEGLQGTYLECG